MVVQYAGGVSEPHPKCLHTYLLSHHMAPAPLLLQAVAVSCFFCLPSTAFVPGAVPFAFLPNRQQESPTSITATAVSAVHEPRRDNPEDHNPSPLGIKRSDRRVRKLGNTNLRAAGGDGASNRGEFLSRVAAGTLAAGTCTAAAAGRPEEARAFCGEPYPYWAYFTDFDEVFIPFKFEGYSGKLFARTVGNEKEQTKVR